MTGYFSIVTKLGRIGSKCVIYLYNLDPARAKEVETWTFSSYAWSFAAGTVIKEITPVVVHFVKDENKEAVRSLELKHEVTKHLGVRYRTDRPNSTATGIAKCNQALARLSQLNLRNIDDKAMATIINSFIISFAQFAALESDATTTQLNKVDRAILNKVRKTFSLARHDMKEIIFLPYTKMGMGIRSFTGTTLAAKAREMECGLNGEMDYAISMRARWQAWQIRDPKALDHNRLNLLKLGLLESNSRMEAAFGIYIRDKRFHLCNVMMDNILLDI